jgi:peptidoglycan/LPS O-acetylase OafA/YrhL
MPRLLLKLQEAIRAAPLGQINSKGSNHYLGLDALRGIAAFAVVQFHFSTRTDLTFLFPHGYLAVDFFFVLSGFVICLSYKHRLRDREMSFFGYISRRLIRVIPLIAFGTLLAAFFEIGRPAIADQTSHIIDVALALLKGASSLPTLHRTTLEYAVFPLNGPAWSLFLEIVANIAFAIWVVSGARAIWIILITFFSLLINIYASYIYGGIGYGAVPPSFWYGFARIGFSFSVGVLLFEYLHLSPVKCLSFRYLALILVGITAVPDLGTCNAYFDIFCVVVVFPLIILAASASKLSPRWTQFSIIFGELSYPIYALHYPVVRSISFLVLKADLPVPLQLFVVFIGTIVIFIMSLLIYLFFDLPARKFLLGQLKGGTRLG